MHHDPAAPQDPGIPEAHVARDVAHTLLTFSSIDDGAVWRGNTMPTPQPGVSSIGVLSASTPLGLGSRTRPATRAGHPAQDSLVIVTAPSGGGTMMHCGRDARLSAGTAALIRPHIPFRVDLSAGSRLLHLVVSSQDLYEREPRLNNAAGRTLTGMVATIASEGWAAASDGTAASGLLDRLALSLGAEIDKDPGGAFGAGELFRRAMAVIIARSAEPDLRALDVAQELGVTVRQLESMFRRRRSSMLEATMTIRVNAAAAQIEAGNGAADLDAVAESTGFYDPSHLQRCWHKINGTRLTSDAAAPAGSVPSESELLLA